ncbi:MAG: UDP-N-acetylglucosamine 2-epimerase, partial [Myxococcaceae bacterium]
MKTVLHIVGARPNFMKVAPVYRAIASRGRLAQKLVHTGQHYDVQMSDVFFRDLGLPAPDIHLGVGSGSHAEQTAKVMVELEKVFAREKPDLI